MPLFNLKCGCGEVVIDKLCSHDKAKEVVCPKCGAIMEIAPVKSGGFRIYGFSAENGYHRDNMSYDGNPNPEW
jgi:hypothetical protein